jgi:hypothetical protein|tara:strand:- start:53 stop:949 length:897 start_codon:yes stop_codon:yes gene_type:complete
MPELDNLLPESFFTDALTEVEEVEEVEEEEVFFKGYVSLEEYVEQNPILGKTIEELKDVFVNNAQEWRKASWMDALKRLYVISKAKTTIASLPTDANGEYVIEYVHGRIPLIHEEIVGVDSILYYYGKFDCFYNHKSFEKSKENFRTYKDPKKLISAMYSYFCSLDESEFKTEWLPEGHSNVQIVPLPDNLGVELYLPKEWFSKCSTYSLEDDGSVSKEKNTFLKSDRWHRFLFYAPLGGFVENSFFSHVIKPEEMVGLAKEAVNMPYADHKETNTWKEIASREPVQFYEDAEEDEML